MLRALMKKIDNMEEQMGNVSKKMKTIKKNFKNARKNTVTKLIKNALGGSSVHWIQWKRE